MKATHLLALAILIVVISGAPSSGQTGFDDSSMRRNIAQRIAQNHQVNVDWRTKSLLDLSDMETRLNIASRIRQNHGLDFDWRKYSLLQLSDTETRLNIVQRIKQNHGVSFDWRKSSLLELSDAETRMNIAQRLSKALRKPVDWRQYTLTQLAEAEAKARGNQPRVAGAAAPATPSVIESKIDGEFEGWEGETIVKLMNGQIWQQTEYHYHYHYAYMPDVLIYNSGVGWKMKVEGVDKAVGVQKLK